ncbi:rhamnan synthesis F family protein, partial [Listeria monocytogenes]|nr:rhamnan synthesis F family protein [Listeria monocytogenes]
MFQLMKQVDLGRYAFICKIHTKKGPNMPNEWRRALLDGVLGSKRQVQHIIERFRADPQVMMAGARQLYVNGPAYL